MHRPRLFKREENCCAPGELLWGRVFAVLLWGEELLGHPDTLANESRLVPTASQHDPFQTVASSIEGTHA